jgi:hypothetical protein
MFTPSRFQGKTRTPKNFYNNFTSPDVIKKLFLMCAIFGVSLASCDKDEPQAPVKQHDTVYTFEDTNPSMAAFYPNPRNSLAKKSADSAEVRRVILRAVHNYSNIDKEGAEALVEVALKPIFALSPKFVGDNAPGAEFAFEEIDADVRQWLIDHGYKFKER